MAIRIKWWRLSVRLTDQFVAWRYCAGSGRHVTCGLNGPQTPGCTEVVGTRVGDVCPGAACRDTQRRGAAGPGRAVPGGALRGVARGRQKRRAPTAPVRFSRD